MEVPGTRFTSEWLKTKELHERWTWACVRDVSCRLSDGSCLPHCMLFDVCCCVLFPGQLLPRWVAKWQRGAFLFINLKKSREVPPEAQLLLELHFYTEGASNSPPLSSSRYSVHVWGTGSLLWMSFHTQGLTQYERIPLWRSDQFQLVLLDLATAVVIFLPVQVVSTTL